MHKPQKESKIMKRFGVKQMNYQHWSGLFYGICIILLASLCFSCGGGGSDGDSSSQTTGSNSFSVEYSNLMYRSYPSGEERYQLSFGIADNGDPCEESDISSMILEDSEDNEVSQLGSGFYQDIYMWYDCSSGTCDQAGPSDETGLWVQFDPLSEGEYSAKIEMVDGQTLDTTMDFPGKVELPYILLSTMSAVWNEGDLQLSWSNPTSESNWDEVNQLRIVITDNLGNSVLYVRPAVTDESITIPAALVAQSAALQGGSGLATWHVQTRAYSTDGMNYTRAFSYEQTLPTS
jgi:hypothetical protein